MKMSLLLVFIALTGCSLLMAKPEVALKSVTLAGVDQKGVELDFLMAVTNPNSFKLNLTGYSYNLIVSSMPLALGESSDEIQFAGNSSTDVRLPVRVSFSDLMQIIKKSPDPEHIPYQLKAGLNLQTPFGHMAIPVEKQGTFAIPSQYQPTRILKQINEFFKKNER
jgi:LEA14-like dessication related protein